MNAARVRQLAVSLGLCALTIGCSSSDDGLSLPTTESSITTSTQSPRTTESVTTTETSTTTPDTKPELEIPTEWESDLDEIFGRYLLYWEAEAIAIGPPAADPSYPPLRELLTEGFLADIGQQMQEYQDANVVSVIPEGSINEHIVRLPSPSVLDKSEGREVVIQDCWVQDTEQQRLDGEITQTVLQSVLFNVTMRVVDDEWRVAASIRASEQSSGYQECTDYVDYLDSSPPCPQCWPFGQDS